MLKKRNRDMARTDGLRHREMERNKESQRQKTEVHKTEMESVTERRREKDVELSLVLVSHIDTARGNETVIMYA